MLQGDNFSERAPPPKLSTERLQQHPGLLQEPRQGSRRSDGHADAHSLGSWAVPYGVWNGFPRCSSCISMPHHILVEHEVQSYPRSEAHTCDEWRKACHLLVYKSLVAVVACPMPPAAAQAAIAAPHAHGAARLPWRF